MVSVYELGLLTSAVRKIAEACPGCTVTEVSMRVGDRPEVVRDSLTAVWPVASVVTQCEGAELDAEFIVSTVYCPACEAEHEIDEFYALTCPVCGIPTADLRHGRELEIFGIEVKVEDES